MALANLLTGSGLSLGMSQTTLLNLYPGGTTNAAIVAKSKANAWLMAWMRQQNIKNISAVSSYQWSSSRQGLADMVYGEANKNVADTLRAIGYLTAQVKNTKLQASYINNRSFTANGKTVQELLIDNQIYLLAIQYLNSLLPSSWPNKI